MRQKYANMKLLTFIGCVLIFLIINHDYSYLTFQYIFQMYDDENESTLQDRLLKMKAITFAQQRQAKLQRKMFDSLSMLAREKKHYASSYYNMILCVKGFKGIMEFAIMNRELQQQEEAEKRQKQAKQRQKHELAQEERMERLINVFQRVRKGICVSKFYRNVRQIIKGKRQKHHQKRIMESAAYKNMDNDEKAYKTSFPLRQRQAQPTDRLHLDRSAINMLQNSRRSVASQGFTTQDQFKRKFAAIKALPPKPQIIAQANRQDQMKPVEAMAEKEDIKNSEFNVVKKDIKQAQLMPIPLQGKQAKKQEQPFVMQAKDKILALLSEIKMVEIMQLTDIIQQYGRTFKNQTNIAQKRHIKQSLKILQRISLIR